MIIKREQKEAIIRHAKGTLPQEACGILAGKDGKVEKVYTLTNISDKPELCYFMDAREQFNIMKKIRKQGLEMVGIYHSHPASAAYPSAKDLELAYYPEAVYVIVSLEKMHAPEVKAYRIVDGKAAKEEVAT